MASTIVGYESMIFKWCDSFGIEHPSRPAYNSLKNTVMARMELERPSSPLRSTPDIRFSKRELLRGMDIISHTAMELNPRANHFYSSSSKESVVMPPSPFTQLPLTTRPACYSTSTSSSSP
ncbi:hypothetical protein LWI28_006099 [Acer negundo]|uniref:Uncharacterized protein n=1 Tax=Acer negundo TaxID=4023 RepID=A0AAD5I5N0_ACENE|nr:hypothetical protein LWI28_006099 [Acer negundo]KAK4834732.1 hypothetical protein QYF36_027445 [Acer negundo]